jgi:hypothetical protein
MNAYTLTTIDGTELEFQCAECAGNFEAGKDECRCCGMDLNVYNKEDEEDDDGEEWFSNKYPDASCRRCGEKLNGNTVVYCGGGGGACETWYCSECHSEGTHDCEVCMEDDHCEMCGVKNAGCEWTDYNGTDILYCDECYDRMMARNPTFVARDGYDNDIDDPRRACDWCGESEKDGKEFTYDDLIQNEDEGHDRYGDWYCKECAEEEKINV